MSRRRNKDELRLQTAAQGQGILFSLSLFTTRAKSSPSQHKPPCLKSWAIGPGRPEAGVEVSDSALPQSALSNLG